MFCSSTLLRAGALLCNLLLATGLRADSTVQTIQPTAFTQAWTNTGLITANDDWAGVPGIIGYRGDGLTSSNDVDPQTVLADGTSTPIDVNANQTNPNTFSTGGVTEFEITNPTIALTGSGTADAPFILMHVNSTGCSTGVRVRYNLRDLDASTDNAAQQVALHYRTSASGNFTNVPSAYVADATSGPSLATLVTPIDVTLPAGANNQAVLQVRVITTNATGNDEWVGIDDIDISCSGVAQPLQISTASPLPNATSGQFYSQVITAAGGSGNYTFSLFNSSLPTGLNLIGNTISGTTLLTGPFQFTIQVNDGSTTAQKQFDLTVNLPPPSCANPTLISAIQGSGSTSPLAGQNVSTVGIVTAIKSAGSSSGFFLQDPTGDANPATSEGIFVFTGSNLPANAAVGNSVCVTGPVVEFNSTQSVPAGSPTLTEISTPNSLTLLSAGNALPAPLPMAACSGAQFVNGEQFECLESMRVAVTSLSVVSPADGSVNESTATATSFGEFTGIIGAPRPFREPGVQLPDVLPSGTSCFPPSLIGVGCIPRFDNNGERIGIDTGDQPGSTLLNPSVGATLTNFNGVLDYRHNQRAYIILTDPSPVPTLSGDTLAATPVATASPDDLRVASMNLERLFDNVDDPGVGDVVVNATAYANRLSKIALSIRDVLKTPDVIAVQEVENLPVLQALAAAVNTAAGTDYTAFLFEGNDPGGIDVGFLVKGRVNVSSVTQEGKTDTYDDPTSTTDDEVFDRPPLFLNGTITRPGSDSAFPFTVMVNHLRSLNGNDTPGNEGLRVRAKRRAGAERAAQFIQARQGSANMVVVGDFNAFDFNDGFVDIMGILKGAPAGINETVGGGDDFLNPNLTNLMETLPASNRYTYLFQGSAQVLDHVLVNDPMANPLRFKSIEVARVNADFKEAFRGDFTRPERYSDHDHPVATFRLPLEVSSKTALVRGGFILNRATQIYSQTVRITNTGGSSLSGPLHLVLENLSTGVTLFNKSGDTPAGKPYRTVNVTLAPGQFTTVTLQFQNPANGSITYSPKVFSINF